MKSALIMFAAIAAVQCGITRVVRQAGWPAPTTQAPGWPAPTTTQGWGNPTTTQGWGQPPSGWAAPASTLSTIDLNAALAAAGSGWAAENHNEAVQVTGAGGWGPNAQLSISANGGSQVDQEGNILQVTSQDAQSAASINNVSVGQIAAAQESEVVDALGLDIVNAQNGWAGASGEGASAADAVSSILVQPAAPANLGMARP